MRIAHAFNLSIRSSLAAAALLLLGAGPVSAQGPCAFGSGGSVFTTMRTAGVKNPTLYNTACTTAIYGPSACFKVNGSFGPLFIANWSGQSARTQDATGRCVFNCPGGSCVIRNDGLPVELEDFKVQENALQAAAPDAEPNSLWFADWLRA